MRMESEESIFNASSSLKDEGLRCPECEYNLTGLDGDVCPECGNAFDREELLAELAGAPQPIPVWSRRGEIGALRAFGFTLLEIWIRPIRFAKRFPKNPQVRDSIVFSRWCLLVAIAICMLPLLIANNDILLASVFVCTSLVIGVHLSERLITVTVFIPITQLSWEKNWYQCGLSFARMTRAYLVLSSIGTSLAFLADLWAPGPLISVDCSLWAAVIAFGYWYLAMLCIATTYRRSAITFFITLFAIPVVTLGGTFAGWFAAGMVVEILF